MNYLVLRFIGNLSLLLFPYRASRFIDRLLNFFVSMRFSLLTGNTGRVFMERPFFIFGHKYIKYDSFSSRSGLRLECLDQYGGDSFSPSISIGRNVCFNFRCHVGVINRIVIGNNVLIGSNVLITDHSHGYNNDSDIENSPAERRLFSKGPVIIEDDVWIGENVCVLPNVTIGHNSIVGANSVVTKNIPP